MHAIRAVRESVVLVLHRIRVSSVSFVGHLEGVFPGFVSLHAPVVVLDFVPGFVVAGRRGMNAGGRFWKLAAGLSIIEECVFIVIRSFCSVENQRAPRTVRIPFGPSIRERDTKRLANGPQHLVERGSHLEAVIAAG